MSTYPIELEENYDTIEQELTENLFKIAEDLYAREWSFNVLNSNKSYEDLCNKGIKILEILKQLYKDGYKKT